MSYITEQILQSLRDARKLKGLSQRELSTLTGVPQSHISKIESGDVDIRISSLIALARGLDMELIIAPKKALPAINSIMRVINGQQDENDQIMPAYSLGDNDE